MSEILKINEATLVEREYALTGSEIDNEFVILEMSLGQYYGLRDVAAFLWREVDSARSIGHLIERTHEQYSIDRETCRADVIAFTAVLVANKLWRTVASA